MKAKPIKWRFIAVLLLSLWGIYASLPTIIYFMQPKEVRNNKEEFLKKIPSWMSSNHVKLGLDLQGGVQLVLGVDTRSAIENRLGGLAVDLKRWADSAQVAVEKAYVKKGENQITVVLPADSDSGIFNEKLRAEFPLLQKKDRQDNTLFYGFSNKEIVKIRQAALEQAQRVVTKRVNVWGVSDASVTRRQDGSLSVQLPGFKDISTAKELLGRTAQLKFKIVDEDFDGFSSLSSGKIPQGIKVASSGSSKQVSFSSENKQSLIDFLQPHVPADKELLFERKALGDGTKAKIRWTSLVLDAVTLMTGSDIEDASVGQNQSGGLPSPAVFLRMTTSGAKRFSEITANNIGKRLAIVLDNEIEQAPSISERIPNGQARISLGGTDYNAMMEEGNKMAMILKSGAIPADLEILEQRQVGASLGPELASKGVQGVMIGLMLVLLFMALYYRRPGLIACLALVLNGVFMIAVMAGFGFVLTLPGIAGFILTLGMAVDANVLINERIREELREGKNIRKAVGRGFDRVFRTILDANITTLIAAAVLLEVNSSGPIRGFAVTIAIGLIVSLFTSLYCTRLFFDVATLKVPDNKLKDWLHGVERKVSRSFDFVKSGRLVTGIVFACVLAVIAGTFTKGVNLGVDFAGGTEVLVSFQKDISANKIREVVEQTNVDGFSVQALDGGKTSYLMKYDESVTESAAASASASTVFLKFKDTIYKGLSDYQPTIESSDFVGPQVGKELRNRGIMSVLLAMVCIFAYIYIRFDSRFAPGALVKMLLDVLLVLGFYVFFDASFDLVAVAAFLTIVGYSVNDTIVIYDRIRENLELYPKRKLFDIINVSINETLSRTINTSFTTMISLAGILIYGSGQVWYFSAAMAIGVFVATITSTFVASFFLLWLENWRNHKSLSKSRL
jgi:protein-export membrane protein SecD/preprotein translocase SecF subunit